MLIEMNISKVQIKGVEYNLMDKEAQSKIAELQSNSYTKTQVNELVNDKADKADVYTKAEVDNAIADVDVSEQLKDYAKKSELPEAYDDAPIKNRIAALEGIDHSQYLTEHQSLADYAKKSELPVAYDDTDVKSRLTALEGKADNDTIYDDTALKARVSALEGIDHSQYLTSH